MINKRYRQRFENYKKIVNQLNVHLAERKIEDFNDLEQTGLSTQFQLSFELMWKLLKDYLEYQEVEIGLISPKNVLRVSASSGLLEEMNVDGDILIQAHRTRNELAHIYDYENAQQALERIKDIYILEMLKVEVYFENK